MVAGVFVLNPVRWGAVGDVDVDHFPLWCLEEFSGWLPGHLDGIFLQPPRAIPPQLMRQQVPRHHASGGTVSRVVCCWDVPPGLRRNGLENGADPVADKGPEVPGIAI